MVISLYPLVTGIALPRKKPAWGPQGATPKILSWVGLVREVSVSLAAPPCWVLEIRTSGLQCGYSDIVGKSDNKSINQIWCKKHGHMVLKLVITSLVHGHPSWYPVNLHSSLVSHRDNRTDPSYEMPWWNWIITNLYIQWMVSFIVQQKDTRPGGFYSIF